MTKREFIKAITPAAIQAAEGSAIFPAVIIARAIIEAGDGKGNYGTSKLVTDANNYFGITASKNYTGAKELFKTWEGKKITIYGEEKFLGEKNGRYNYLRYFREYPTAAASFKDFVKLVSSGRYKEAVNAPNAKEQAGIIARAGYATAKNAEKLFVDITGEVQSAIDKAIEIVKEKKEEVEKYVTETKKEIVDRGTRVVRIAKKKKSEIGIIAAILSIFGIGIYLSNK
jgi:flagellum-specific peptidoglycan hydrolase FlgJ